MTDKTSWGQMAEKELRGKPLKSLTWDTLEVLMYSLFILLRI